MPRRVAFVNHLFPFGMHQMWREREREGEKYSLPLLPFSLGFPLNFECFRFFFFFWSMLKCRESLTRSGPELVSFTRACCLQYAFPLSVGKIFSILSWKSPITSGFFLYLSLKYLFWFYLGILHNKQLPCEGKLWFEMGLALSHRQIMKITWHSSRVRSSKATLHFHPTTTEVRQIEPSVIRFSWFELVRHAPNEIIGQGNNTANLPR